MKNVAIKSSILLSCVSLAIVTKYWVPMKEYFKSQNGTQAMKAEIQKSKPNPAKVFLKEAMLAQRTELEGCYDEFLRREPSKSNGSIAVRWVIGAEGKVESPSIADAEIEDADLRACVIEQVSQMTFDPNQFEENMHFSYRFHFKARAPSSIDFQ